LQDYKTNISRTYFEERACQQFPLWAQRLSGRRRSQRRKQHSENHSIEWAKIYKFVFSNKLGELPLKPDTKQMFLCGASSQPRRQQNPSDVSGAHNSESENV
jgi:hypothetical protein